MCSVYHTEPTAREEILPTHEGRWVQVRHSEAADVSVETLWANEWRNRLRFFIATVHPLPLARRVVRGTPRRRAAIRHSVQRGADVRAMRTTRPAIE